MIPVLRPLAVVLPSFNEDSAVDLHREHCAKEMIDDDVRKNKRKQNERRKRFMNCN